MPSDQQSTNGVVQTVGAVTVVLATMTLPISIAGFVEAWAVTHDTVSGDGAMIKMMQAGQTNGAGVVTAIGANATILARADASLATASVAIVANGLVSRVGPLTGLAK